MYAIIETGGKQIKVTEGQEIYIEKVNADVEETVNFDKVLFVGGDDVKVGAPYVEGASVDAKVEKQGRQKKITVFKYKPKKNYSRKQGHRDRKSTRLNSSHVAISYAVVCVKKK